jgi:peptide/nickel transport system substrate-binding protein
VLRRFAISCLAALLTLPVAARTRPHYGGTLHVEIEGDPWKRPDGMARRLVLDGLTVLDGSGSVRPALATDWESDSGDHHWQFRLRPGVHFHDSTPLTSVNVVASLNAACPADCPWTAVRAVGSSVVFLGDAAMPNLPALLAGDEFLIALTVTSDGKTPNGNIGTGPFQLTGFSNGVLSLAAYGNCWQGRPFADAIELHVHRAVRDQWLDLGVGRADVVEVPAEMMRQAQQQRLSVVTSRPVSLLALQVSDAGALANPVLRTAIALAIDRGALYNVIFQKQGEITASLLPQSLTGYGFLFPADRDLNKAHELRGGLTTPPLTLSGDGSGAVQLAAQRIALDLRESGFNVQMAKANEPHSDLVLRKLPLAGADPAATLEELLRSAGQPPVSIVPDPSALLKAERDLIDRHTLVPLLNLPRAYATGARMRDFHLRADGEPDLAAASLEDAP